MTWRLFTGVLTSWAMLPSFLKLSFVLGDCERSGLSLLACGQCSGVADGVSTGGLALRLKIMRRSEYPLLRVVGEIICCLASLPDVGEVGSRREGSVFAEVAACGDISVAGPSD